MPSRPELKPNTAFASLGLPNHSLNRGLIAEDFEPLALSLGPHACDVKCLAVSGALSRRHNHGVPELKHACRNKGKWRDSSLLLLVEAHHSARLVEWTVTIGRDCEELIGDVGAPSSRVVCRHRSFHVLVCKDEFVFIFVLRGEWHGLAGIFAVLCTGLALRGHTELTDFLIYERLPTCRTSHPHPQDIGLATLSPVNQDLTVHALLSVRLTLVAKRWLG